MVTQKKIRDLEAIWGHVNSGSTNDIVRRKGEKERDGYSGQMFYAKTEIMKTQENKMLEREKPRHNVHKKSGQAEKPGFIYIIVGRRNRRHSI